MTCNLHGTRDSAVMVACVKYSQLHALEDLEYLEHEDEPLHASNARGNATEVMHAGYCEVIHHHTIGFQTIPRAGFKWDNDGNYVHTF